jgi:ComF family protein
VGERSGVLRRIIDCYKFYNAYAAHRDLASLLSDRIGVLPKECVIVPIPTVSSHTRQRGYDHVLLVAKRLAKLQSLKVETVLRRRTATKQLGKSRKDRFVQARQAFEVRGTLRGDVVYLLVDDVVTTGATLEYAARALKQAGATTVWAAAIARQPLD